LNRGNDLLANSIAIPTTANIVLPITSLDGLPDAPEVPGPLGETLISELPTPEIAGRASSLPMDVAGQLAVPALPSFRASKRNRAKAKGQKVVRRGRKIVLRKSVLSLVLGRQLAGPTIDALKVISRGQTIV